jgi:dTDP-glucose 4,6-dehydratase
MKEHTMNETCLVIGSNSFSGSNFIASLIDNSYDVIGVSRSIEPHDAFLPYKLKGRPWAFKFVQCDLNHEIDKLMSLILEHSPSYIVNFAAQNMVAESWKYPVDFFKTNVLSTTLLHENLRKCSFLKTYLHITTPEVYGNTVGWINESTAFNPSTPYAVSRACADMNLKVYFSQYGFPVVLTRSANVFGPRQQPYRIIPRTILSIKSGRKLPLHGGGLSHRSFVYIPGYCEALLGLMRYGIHGEAYHISNKRVISIHDLVTLICKLMNVDPMDFIDIVDERPGKDASYLLDSNKIETLLDWQDRISLEQGIDETIEWIEYWWDFLKQQPLGYVHKP